MKKTKYIKGVVVGGTWDSCIVRCLDGTLMRCSIPQSGKIKKMYPRYAQARRGTRVLVEPSTDPKKLGKIVKRFLEEGEN